MTTKQIEDVSLSDEAVPISAVYAAMIDTAALDGWTDVEIAQWCTELLEGNRWQKGED